MLRAKVSDSFLNAGGSWSVSHIKSGVSLVWKVLEMHPISCLKSLASLDVLLLTCSCPDGDTA